MPSARQPTRRRSRRSARSTPSRSCNPACLVEAPDPLGAGLLQEAFADLGIQPVAVLRALGPVGIGWVAREIVGRQGLAEALPDRLAGSGDVDVPVRGLEHPRWNAGRV